MDFIRNRRILVTGGAGFIGSHLVDGLIRHRPSRIVVVDNLSLGSKSNLESARRSFPGLRFCRENAENIRAMKALLRSEKVDLVFNLATRPLPAGFGDPDGTFRTSVDIARTFAELLRKGAYDRLVQFSTSEVYGSAVRVPMDENHPLRPTTPYAAGKLAADLLLRTYADLYSLRILIVRPFNNYGPRQNAGIYAGVVPQTIRRILRGESPILEGDGRQTRDFVFVEDTVRMAIGLACTERAWGKVINIASGGETRIGSVLRGICKHTGYSGGIRRLAARPGDHRRHCGDATLALSLLKGFVFSPFPKGLRRTVDWYVRERQVADGNWKARGKGLAAGN